MDDEPTTVETVSPDTLRDVFPQGVPPQPVQLAFSRGTYHKMVPQGERQVAVEIFTRNRIYVIGMDMTCMQVIDRRTRAVETTDHRAIGARLSGGQRRYGKTIHFTRPFPIPGTEAVFEREGQKTPAAITSRVDAVRLYVRVDSVVLDDEGAWEEVTNAMLRPTSGSSG